MVRIISFVFAVALAGLFTAPALAAGLCNGCKITMLGSGPYYDALCTSGSCVYVKMEVAVSTRPSCASNTGWDFVLDTSTQSGRGTYAMLLTAYSSSELLAIGGTGACALSGGGAVEDLRYAAMYKN